MTQPNPDAELSGGRKARGYKGPVSRRKGGKRGHRFGGDAPNGRHEEEKLDHNRRRVKKFERGVGGKKKESSSLHRFWGWP